MASGFKRRATRRAPGTASLSNSRNLPIRSGRVTENAVTLPPGRARLATRPSSTGSPTAVKTMGIVAVARLAPDRQGNEGARSFLRSAGTLLRLDQFLVGSDLKLACLFQGGNPLRPPLHSYRMLSQAQP